MTNISFFKSGRLILGFEVTGHATKDAEDLGGKLVCSAVSSAAFMTSNTITDVIGAKADITISDGEMILRLTDKFTEAQPILKGFELHITELSKQFKDYIRRCNKC